MSDCTVLRDTLEVSELENKIPSVAKYLCSALTRFFSGVSHYRSWGMYGRLHQECVKRNKSSTHSDTRFKQVSCPTTIYPSTVMFSSHGDIRARPYLEKAHIPRNPRLRVPRELFAKLAEMNSGCTAWTQLNKGFHDVLAKLEYRF